MSKVMKSHIRNDDSGLNGMGAKGVFAPSGNTSVLICNMKAACLYMLCVLQGTEVLVFYSHCPS